MGQTTITEALAELHTIDKRLAKKKDFICSYLWRQDMLKDPLEKEGGAEKAIKEALQSVADLGARKIAIRRAIQKANAETSITIEEQTQSLADWLTWRRDVVPFQQQLYNEMRQQILKGRTEAKRIGANVGGAQGGELAPIDVRIHVDEGELARTIEKIETILGALDGQLSLKNATVMIELAD